MLGNIQTLLSGRNWLCLILKPHNKGYISFVSILNLSINSGYFTFFLPFFSVPLPSLCPCLPHPLPSGSLPPSLPVSFLHSLTTYHSSRHCLPSLTPSIPPCLFSSVPACISLSSTLLPFLYAFHPSLPSSITPLPGPLSPF